MGAHHAAVTEWQRNCIVYEQTWDRRQEQNKCFWMMMQYLIIEGHPSYDYDSFLFLLIVITCIPTYHFQVYIV